MSATQQVRLSLGTIDMCRQKFYSQDFSGLDLTNKKMRQSMFMNCKFDGANLTEADCEGSDFFGSSFRETICYRTNFKDAKLAGTLFEPKDCFGMTITMQCQTFDGMRVSPIWLYGWLIFATMMRPVKMPAGEDLMNGVIAAIGAERYVKLRSMFTKRDL